MIPNKNTFCVNPWLTVALDSDNKLSPCCYIPGFNYNYQNIEKYFKSKELNDIRKDLLTGVKNKNCNKCWQKESQGMESQRQISNRTIKGNIRKQISDPTTEDVVHIDFVLGNLCNLKCLMCKPLLSSQILAEAIKHPELKEIYDSNTSYVQKHFDWPKHKEFKEWCKIILPRCKKIHFGGGEPFIIPWIPKVLKDIDIAKKKQMTLHITTNLTIINDEILEAFNNFKEVWLSVSFEGTEDTFEYVRNGHNWETIKKNVKYIKDKNFNNLYFGVNNVIQATSFHSILSLVDFCDKNDMKINPLPLDRPESFHISALTKESKLNFLNHTAQYQGINKDYIKFVRNLCITNIEQNHKLSADCIRLLEKYDKVRKTNWKKIIPLENLQKN